MKRATILLATTFLVTLLAYARLFQVHDLKTLVAESTLVFVGSVKSVTPTGITTSLSYPTWEGAVFEWLRVDVDVLEPIKGTRKGAVVQTAMLSLKTKVDGMYSPPGMLEPDKGKAFLLFLVPTTRTNLFAAVTAPYDEDESIFILDRSFWKYGGYQETKEQRASPFRERREVIWSLVDEKGQTVPGGADLMRKTFEREIRMGPSNQVVHLQYQKYTNPSGWFHDVPKDESREAPPNQK